MRTSTLIIIAAATFSGAAIADEREPQMETLVVTAPRPAKLDAPTIEIENVGKISLKFERLRIEPPTVDYESESDDSTRARLASSDDTQTRT